ncbi:MAG: hypothetical protein HY299_15805 [Verrucomicrobia bacterium]|nr:hypothetical protein [Verrucomicrobiota bacterium]
MPRSRKPKKDPEVFAFRILDVDDRAAFLKQAKAQGMRPNDLARLFVLDAVRGKVEKENASEELANVRDEVLATRKDLALATRIILEYGGKAKREKAQEWVKQRLNRPVSATEPISGGADLG